MTREEYLNLLLKFGVAHRVKRKEKQTAYADKYPQGYFKPKSCRNCGRIFQPKAPSEHYCSDWCKDYALVNHYYLRNYGITIDEYLDMAEAQDYKCAICHRENFPMGINHTGVLVVDRDHETGKVRGLLCHNCNRALGLLQDNVEYLQNAINYLNV